MSSFRMFMHTFRVLYTKEFTQLFISPVAFAIGAMFMLISGFFFYNIVSFYALASQQLAMQGMSGGEGGNVTDGVLTPFHLNIALIALFLLPLLTMRLLAEEKKTGTFELLISYPVTNSMIVGAKFCAAVSFYALLLILSLYQVLLLSYFASPSWTVVFVSLFGLFLLGSGIIALGIFISSLTENQIIAGGLTFGFSLLFWIIGWVDALSSSSVGSVLHHLSLIVHYQDFSRGLISSVDVIYFCSFIFLMLYLAVFKLENDRWRM